MGCGASSHHPKKGKYANMTPQEAVSVHRAEKAAEARQKLVAERKAQEKKMEKTSNAPKIIATKQNSRLHYWKAGSNDRGSGGGAATTATTTSKATDDDDDDDDGDDGDGDDNAAGKRKKSKKSKKSQNKSRSRKEKGKSKKSKSKSKSKDGSPQKSVKFGGATEVAAQVHEEDDANAHPDSLNGPPKFENHPGMGDVVRFLPTCHFFDQAPNPVRVGMTDLQALYDICHRKPEDIVGLLLYLHSNHYKFNSFSDLSSEVSFLQLHFDVEGALPEPKTQEERNAENDALLEAHAEASKTHDTHSDSDGEWIDSDDD